MPRFVGVSYFNLAFLFVVSLSLTGHSSDLATVVCIGAAPGSHLPFLTSLFPDATFHVFDARDVECEASERVMIYTHDFSDEVAARFAGTRALFISDICSADPLKHTPQEIEEHCAADMAAQRRWAVAMRAHHCSLRFRLPWAPGTTEYLDGQLQLPVWGCVS